MKKIFLLISVIVTFSCEKEEKFNGTACIDMPLIGYPVNQEIQFSNCSENASHYLWNFGDGTISTLENPTHMYTEAKSYRVTLLAQNTEIIDVNGDGVYNAYDALEGKTDVAQVDIVITTE